MDGIGPVDMHRAGVQVKLGWCVKDKLTEDMIQTLTLTPGSLESNPTSST